MSTLVILFALFLGFILFWTFVGIALVIGQALYTGWTWHREIRKRGYPPCLHDDMTADQLEKLAALRRAREGR